MSRVKVCISILFLVHRAEYDIIALPRYVEIKRSADAAGGEGEGMMD